jgi:putative ABC transport system permease protein
MAQAVRERIEEIGVLKAIGFTHRQVLGLVLVEACVLAGGAGLVGLGVGYLLISMGDPTGGAFPVFFFPPEDIAKGALIALLLGLAAGALPALQAMRLDTATALRRQ